MNPILLIVEDDDVIRKTLTEVFSKRGYKVFPFDKGKEAMGFVRTHQADIVLLDLRLLDVNGLVVLKDMHEVDDDIMVIVLTAYPDVKTAVSAMKAGAHDYINKPFELEELKIVVDKAAEIKRLKAEVEVLRHQKAEDCAYEMVGVSPGLSVVKSLIAAVANKQTPVMIRGETGTGKELVARAVHCSSDRRNGAFIKLNCSAIPDTLLESEMFGYEKGAFTDAREGKKGLFELADGGTIFLDEIGDMDLRLQPKLLHILENHTFRKIGGVRDIRLDVRVVAATNKDLEEMVKEKKFRADLYYRLNGVVINIPSLRERREDIISLAEYFMGLYGKDNSGGVRRLLPECREMLLKYSWPGNVRELKNIIERALIISSTGEITPEHLPQEFNSEPVNDPQSRLPMTVEELEKAYILNVLEQVKGNKTQAAKILGISRVTVREKLKK